MLSHYIRLILGLCVSVVQYNPSTGGRGSLITFQPTLERYISRCYEPGCVDHFGVGTFLSTDNSGSVAQLKNRCAFLFRI